MDMTPQPLGTARDIEAWCVDYICRTLHIPRAKIDPRVEVDSFGLDSATAVALIMELESELNMELAPELLFEYPTLASLSEHLAGRRAVAGALQ